jgi:uncharacterized protein (DUF433 family)
VNDAAVWIDPGRCSGEPCVSGHRIPVELVIGSVWWHGVDSAMGTYALTREEVLGACWYAGAGNVVRLHGKGGRYVARRGPWRKRWGAWAWESHDALWNHLYDDVNDPPRGEEVNEDRTIKVTREQVLAARVRVAGDRALGRETPNWIHRLAAVTHRRTCAADADTRPEEKS